LKVIVKKNGVVMMRGGTPIERVLVRIEQDASGCILWLGRVDGKGYGRLANVKGKTGGAHRITYEAAYGPIPAGLDLDHLCRVTRCVNPRHLEPVTSGENTRRSPIHNGAKTHCPQGHEYTEANTYRWPGAPGASRQCRTCMADVQARRPTM